MNWSAGLHQWSLSQETVTSLPAKEMTEKQFRHQHVDRSVPIHIQGGAAHWPAMTRWRRPDYLARTLGANQLMVHQQPVGELKWRAKHWPERFANLYSPQDGQLMTFPDFQSLVEQNEFAFTYALPMTADSDIAGLSEDVGSFDFLPDVPPARYYSRFRAFFHGRSLTDWHYHPNDETLMCQFGVSKRVWLMPPTQATWNVMFELGKSETYLGSTSPQQYPMIESLKPISLQVNPGDALYIPPHWWHAVECDSNHGEVGATIAYCWASPFHIRMDPRFPIKRFRYQQASLPKRAKHLVGALAWSSLRLTGQPVPNLA